MAVLIIFPVILQTVINLIMLSIGGQGELVNKDDGKSVVHKVEIPGQISPKPTKSKNPPKNHPKLNPI